MTQIKIFTALGAVHVLRMQEEVNDWLTSMGSKIEVVSVTPALCSVGDWGQEFYQYMTVTVVYRAR